MFQTIVFFLCLFVVLGSVLADETCSKGEYNVPRIDDDIIIDGIVDEEAWGDAAVIHANIEVAPGENITASVKTTVLMAYDEKYVYVAFLADDPDPSEILVRLSERDSIWSDDWVMIVFDTFDDHRRSYNFACNPLGVQRDYIQTTGDEVSWDAIWESAGKIGEQGYRVEMAIPFGCMNFRPGGDDQRWGFDAVRSYPRKVRRTMGVFPRDRNNNCYLCQSHKLIGFSKLDSKKKVEIAPTISFGLSQERFRNADGSYSDMREKRKSTEPGVTARWAVTSNMTMSFAANPDFSQVEADAAEMEINTRFPLYYSEKRPFFLENADVFDTGTSIVYTRRLADPDWGVKLTGKSDRNTIGILLVRDNYTPLVFSGSQGGSSTTLSMQSTGSVVRYKRDIGSSSSAGIVLVDREGTDYYNRLGGLDANMKFTPTNHLHARIFGAVTQYPDRVAVAWNQSDNEMSGVYSHVNYTHETESYGIILDARDVGEDFRADLGYITQTGYRWRMLKGLYKWRNTADHWYNFLMVTASHDHKQDSKGDLLYKAFTARLIYDGPHQSWFGMYGEAGKSRFRDKYFRRNTLDIWGGFKPAGSIELSCTGFLGDRIDYDNARAGNVLGIRPGFFIPMGSRFLVNGQHEIQRLDVDAGRLYTANVSNLTFKVQFSKRLFVRTQCRYTDYRRNPGHYLYDGVDVKTRRFFTQILLSYTANPRTVCYLGYSDNYQNRDLPQEGHVIDNNLIRKNRAVFAKIGYAFEI